MVYLFTIIIIIRRALTSNLISFTGCSRYLRRKFAASSQTSSSSSPLSKKSTLFTNTGNQPLKITNAKGSCGCTVPSWRKKDGSSTWAPGESGEIRVRYDTKRVGVINKSVTIQSNAMNSDNITRSKKDSEGKVIGGTSTIRIKGEVKAPKTNATPMKPAQGPVNSSE